MSPEQQQADDGVETGVQVVHEHCRAINGVGRGQSLLQHNFI
jgi:hypothetical protein